MGHIRERNLKNGGVRYRAEVRLKGHPCLTAMFDRKTDAKNQIQKVEADIRCGRHPISNWIGEVFPVPKDSRKGHPSKNGVAEDYFNNLISIPEIFLENGNVINFLNISNSKQRWDNGWRN